MDHTTGIALAAAAGAVWCCAKCPSHDWLRHGSWLTSPGLTIVCIAEIRSGPTYAVVVAAISPFAGAYLVTRTGPALAVEGEHRDRCRT